MYTFNSRVRYSETDEYGRLSATGIMDYLQDCSTFQSEDLGLGISYLERSERAWWLSAWQIVIDRYPVMGEEIVVGTWPYAFKGMYGYRNFVIMDRGGNYLVRADSTWFFFDTSAQRPVKVQEADIRGYGSGEEEKLEMEYAPRKIQVPAEYETGEPILIAKHHIDTNHHVNNAKYMEIARELIPDRYVIKKLRVEYKKAAVFGDVVIPHIGKTEQLDYVISLCDQEGEPFAIIWLSKQA